jgi:hypothetical protein
LDDAAGKGNGGVRRRDVIDGGVGVGGSAASQKRKEVGIAILCACAPADQCDKYDKGNDFRRRHGFGSYAAKPLSKQKRAHLLTPQDRHWYAQEGTLSARPVWACFKQCPSFKITSFVLDSSRSRKFVVLIFLH